MEQGDPGGQHQARVARPPADVPERPFREIGGAAEPTNIRADVAYWALLGHREMSDLSPQSGPKRTLIRPLSPVRAEPGASHPADRPRSCSSCPRDGRPGPRPPLQAGA